MSLNKHFVMDAIAWILLFHIDGKQLTELVSHLVKEVGG
jgi:hypothetical protein